VSKAKLANKKGGNNNRGSGSNYQPPHLKRKRDRDDETDDKRNKKRQKRSNDGRPLKIAENVFADNNHNSDEVDVMPEDIEFFKQHGEYIELIDRINPKELDPKIKGSRRSEKRKREEEEEAAMPYETTSRKPAWEREAEREKESYSLPIKQDGRVLQMSKLREVKEVQEVAPEEEIDDASADVSEDEDDGEDLSGLGGSDYSGDELEDENQRGFVAHGADESEDEDNLDYLELKMYEKRQAHIAKRKEVIATTAASILEDPENRIKRLKELRDLSKDSSDAVKKLLILSELAVYKDLAPGYRITVHHEDDPKVKISKDVKKLREFEATLLAAYQKYLQYLDHLIKSAMRNQNADVSESSLPAIAIRCLTQLLLDLTFFNYRSNIIQTLVPLMNSHIDVFSDLACKAMEMLFKKDIQGDACLEAVRIIAQMVKAKGYSVRHPALRTFLKLNLTEELDEGEDIINPENNKYNKRFKMTKKMKKKRKEEKELERDMRMAEAEQNREDKKQNQKEILKAVFLTYFRILKKARGSNLLPYVLEGLARFSHLINLELLVNLLQVLRELISSKKLSLLSSLNCALTAFQALKMEGDTLSIDLKDFYTEFYCILLKLITCSPAEQTELIPLTISCLQLMLYERRQLSMDRVAAFVKRVLIIAMQLQPNASIALLVVVRDLLRKYPKAQQLLDSEVTASGEFLAEIDDPEHCNPFATQTWEFGLLAQHYHPTLAKLARVVALQEQVNVSKTAHALVEKFDWLGTNAGSTAMTGVASPTPHVLQTNVEKYQKKLEQVKSARARARLPVKAWFVQPQLDVVKSSFMNGTEQRYDRIMKKLNTADESQLFREVYEDAVNTVQVVDD
jgi:nucleolar complex protein 3